MKKLILSIIGLTTAFTLFSQQNLNIKRSGILNPKTTKKTETFSKSIESSAWYNPLNILSNSYFKTYVGFMMNDSLAKFVNEQGVASQSRTFQAIAQIVDPKDNAIDLSADPTIKLSKFTNYIVDSISFRYSYVRRVDSTDDGLGGKKLVTDTLFIYYFAGDKVQKYPKKQWASSLFGYLGYDFAKRRPSNFTKMDTILLTANLSTGKPSSTEWSARDFGIRAPAGLNFNANGGLNVNNIMAFAVQFKSGMKYDTTYTFEDRRDSLASINNKWVNYFCFHYGANEGASIVSTFYNSSLLAPQHFTYGTTNGWDGWYPGQGFDKNLYIDAGMKLSSEGGSVKGVANSFSLGQAYPNPSSNVVNIAFDLKANNNVKVSILNLLGQEVINVADDKFAAGKNEVSVDVSNLNAGVYFYSMTVDGVSQAQKLIIK